LFVYVAVTIPETAIPFEEIVALPDVTQPDPKDMGNAPFAGDPLLVTGTFTVTLLNAATVLDEKVIVPSVNAAAPTDIFFEAETDAELTVEIALIESAPDAVSELGFTTTVA
jgi:hypothetical protein